MAGKFAKYRKAAIQLLIVVVILFFGVWMVKFLTALKKPPQKQKFEAQAPLVNAIKVNSQDINMTVTGYGTVRPKQQVQIVPQVSGRIVQTHSEFYDGGFFKAGETLLQIERADYELAVQSARAQVARAEVALDRELSEAEVAKREWQQLNPGKAPTSELVLRKPQIAQAQAELAAAMASLETAKLNLARTTITLDFDGRVSSESVDVGQYITPGQPIGTAYSTEAVEIVVPLEDEQFEWLEMPLLVGNIGRDDMPRAVVKANFAGRHVTWDGYVTRTQGQIDPVSRVVNVVVEVPEPFERANSKPPLTPGMFAEVEIQGRHVRNVTRVPRHAVHEGNVLWVVNDSKLHIQPVRVIRKDRETAFITTGISGGDIIVTTPLEAVVDKMDIRVAIEQTNTKTVIQETGAGD